MPAKLYGQLVGGPVQALRSGLIGIVPPHCKDSSDMVLARDYVTLAGNVIGDQISLGTFKSTAFIDPLGLFFNNDVAGTTTLNVGDATHPSGLVANVAYSTPPGWFGISIVSFAASVGALLWQALGYAVDPGGNIELLATFATANPPNGGLAWQIYGRP